MAGLLPICFFCRLLMKEADFRSAFCALRKTANLVWGEPGIERDYNRYLFRSVVCLRCWVLAGCLRATLRLSVRAPAASCVMLTLSFVTIFDLARLPERSEIVITCL
jgi:hypothetical protein